MARRRDAGRQDVEPGRAPPASILGRSFAPVLRDPGRSIRGEVYAERNWHDFEDRARAVRSPSFEAVTRLRDAGALTRDQNRVFDTPRPAEELYDTEADPHELRSLAGEAAQAATEQPLREKLEASVAASVGSAVRTSLPGFMSSGRSSGRLTGVPSVDGLLRRPRHSTGGGGPRCRGRYRASARR